MEDAFVNVDAQINEAQLWAYLCTPELATEWVMVKFAVFGPMCLSRETRPVRSQRRSWTHWSSPACLFTKCVHVKDVNSLFELVEGMVVEGGGSWTPWVSLPIWDWQAEAQPGNYGWGGLLAEASNTPMVLARSIRVMATNAAQPVNKLILQHAG